MPTVHASQTVAAAALATVAVIASPVTAQTEQQSEEQAEEQAGAVQPASSGIGEVQFIVRGGAYLFNTDIDGGGDVESWAVRAGFEFRTQLSEQFGLSGFTGIERLDYTFGGPEGFGGLDPWDDINVFGAGFVLSYQVDDQWTVSGGPVFQMAWESGADAGDGIQAGGVFAASYRFSDRLTLGGGFGVASQIENDAQAFPVLVVDWKINDQLRLLSRRATGGGPFTGTELVWSAAPKWELALGGNFRKEQRFRLDDDGIAPKGVGRTREWPVWFGATFKPTPDITLDGFVGVLLGGELLLEDDNGKRIAEDDIDPMPAIGLTGRIVF